MKLQIGENLYELEYTINSICDLEEITGKMLGDVMLGGGGYKKIRLLLWCGLLEHNPKMTIKTVGTLMQEYLKDKDLGDLIAVIGEAIEQAGFLKAQGLINPKK